MNKKEILEKFSADPQRYYNVNLFEDQGFERKSCTTCNRFFWTLDSERVKCPDHSDDTYSFIGAPPTSKRFDYTQSWKEVESFFVKNNQTWSSISMSGSNNGALVGPVTVSGTITIPSGSTFVIL